jgi:glycosyltransferase involved in cell wall biosynthesis
MEDQLFLNEHSVSVVVPSYNHAQFVGSCLRSIIRQTHPPKKLLVIDDGSRDGSTQVIESVLEECPFPSELIARGNLGLSATLNQGLELTGGDYFAYLSSDDVWLDNFLAARIKTLRNRPNAVLAYGNSYLIDEQNKVVDCTADWAHYKDGDVREMLLQTTAPMSPTVLYKRESIERHGWNEGSGLEDYELYLKLSLDGEFAFDPQVLSAWRGHETNTSWDQEMMLAEHLSALRRVAPELGIGEHQLETLTKEINFNRVEDFLRLGDKKRATQLALRSLKGVSFARLIRVLGRLTLPYSAVSWWRRRRHHAATQQYGRLDV